ncbi:MAG: hypothetical protein ALECFALPRED_008155 [Alectoria fallacina]|uniref:Uncharacterized protein n=1 Tax=Alectoria fallacina TaxID=1903189 RepID=A0A8H3PFY0_9LECA|nr:MAG: hypothetical protein ALECFALPRED_008155 [Alectoria fallacina]
MSPGGPASTSGISTTHISWDSFLFSNGLVCIASIGAIITKFIASSGAFIAIIIASFDAFIAIMPPGASASANVPSTSKKRKYKHKQLDDNDDKPAGFELIFTMDVIPKSRLSFSHIDLNTGIID